MRKLAIIDKNPLVHLTQWRAAYEPRKFFGSNSSTEDQIRHYKPDIIFLNKSCPFINLRSILKDFRTVYFYGDFYQPIPEFVFEHSKLCGAVILTNRHKPTWQLLKSTGQKNIFFASQGADIEVFKPLKNEPKKYDIVFAGNYYGPKFCGSDIRLKLARHLKNLKYNTQIIGDSWPKDIGALPRQGHIKLNKSINQSKITVGMSHFIDIDFYTSNRLYQSMATGVPHIAWASPGISKLFSTGYLEVNSYDKLDAQIEKLLTDKNLRNHIGNLQRLEIFNNHTIFHAWNRIEEIFKKMKWN